MWVHEGMHMGALRKDNADDEDELMLTAKQEKQLQQQDAVIPANTITDLDLDDGSDMELRMDVFLNDPELSLKIFFSHFYKDKGLWWSMPKLCDSPILIRFFLQFFICNQLMNDYNCAFNKALLLVDLAHIELPLMSKISIQVPDVFSWAYGALWGSKVPSIWDTGEESLSVLEPEKTETTKSNVKTDKNKEWEAELERQGVEKINLSTILPPLPTEPQPSSSSFSATVPLCFAPPFSKWHLLLLLSLTNLRHMLGFEGRLGQWKQMVLQSKVT
ncbi:hypothetical protein BU17DRAFT_70767 [Hysterangium stoloniferum]|nr:hypothetical protein BU17DRAFT_70767 [Hysterangium stoloniferum]